MAGETVTGDGQISRAIPAARSRGLLGPLHQDQSGSQVSLPGTHGEEFSVSYVTGPLGVQEGLLRHCPEDQNVAELWVEMKCMARGSGSPLGRGAFWG